MCLKLPFTALVSLGLCCLCGCLPTAQNHDIPKLELVKVLPVDAPYPLEPSGLTLFDGTFFTVADKVDPIIFALEIGDQSVQLKEALVFFLPEKGPMDWEGICADPSGTFYLISESKGRVLQVTSDAVASWNTDDLRPSGQKEGLFAKDNAGFEGITWLGPNHWLAAIEREPRGLLEWQGADYSRTAKAFLLNHSPFQHALSFLRFADYSGLDFHDGSVYALFRNAHLVVKLEKHDHQWQETQAWDYRHIETDPRFAYKNQAFGQAEGLVVRGQNIYLIFDNNRGPRASHPEDSRPLFVHARLPKVQ